jgi:hypothetical protein
MRGPKFSQQNWNLGRFLKPGSMIVLQEIIEVPTPRRFPPPGIEASGWSIVFAANA